jgi:hypothetical protein
MTFIIIGGMALLAYSAWMTYALVGANNKVHYVRKELDIARARLQSLSMEHLHTMQMYEERLRAKQEAIDAFKKLLGDVDNLESRALDYGGSLSEAPTPPLGTLKDDPTR